MDKLSDRLRFARHLSGLTQGDLAQILDISSRTLGRYERGDSTPNDTILLRICDTVGKGIDFAWLKTGESTENAVMLPSGVRLSTPSSSSMRDELFGAITDSLHLLKVVGRRFDEGVPQKAALAEAFNDLYGDYIWRHPYKEVFLESGSTLAFVAERLARRFKDVGASDIVHVAPKVITNNAIVFLYYWLCKKITCYQSPHGPPDLQYGGMFGPLARFNREPAFDSRPLKEIAPGESKKFPDVIRDLLYETAKREGKTEPITTAVDTTTKNPSTENKNEKPHPRMLILAAQSALQLSDDVSASFADDGKDVLLDEGDPLLEKLKPFRGFHVGSFQNKLFKRCLAEINAPTIYFIHDEKIDCVIKTEKCHFIFDEGKPWATFTKDHPISLWIGCRRKKDDDNKIPSYDEILSKCKVNLTDGGWEFTVYGEASPNPIVIGHNKAFREISKEVDVYPIS